ncbi:MAG: acetyl esterase/lipase [Verrucomicrobiales bacterium]|jgi:acetyl esterase/lipase
MNMRTISTFIGTALLGTLAIPLSPLMADHHKELKETPVWPQSAPDEPANITEKKKDGEMGKDGTYRIPYVDSPTLTWYPAAEDKANGACVVICPGGGYNILAWNLEGTEVAEWLNSIGVSAAVLKYRVPRRDPENPHAWPLQDVQRAIRIVRSEADDRKIDANRIGVLGFSAGGHLTIMAGTHWNEQSYSPIDSIDKVSARPDFLIPIYPAYLGDKEQPGKLSPLVHVTEETPPAFIAITHDDADRSLYAALFYAALRQNSVMGEIHIYSKGGHGYGLRPSDNPVHTWPQRCAEWLDTAGFLKKK